MILSGDFAGHYWGRLRKEKPEKLAHAGRRLIPIYGFHLLRPALPLKHDNCVQEWTIKEIGMYRILLPFIVLILLGASLAGSVLAQEPTCEDAIGCVTLGPDDPVTIAWMQTVSGPTSFFGDDAVGGIEIAMEQRDYTVLGREIELIGEDSLCNPEGGQTAAQRLVSDPQVVAIIGPSCSSAAVPAIPIASNAGFLMVSPMTTSSALTNPDRDAGGVWMPGFFRTVYNNLLEGAVAAQFAYDELGARTMATIHDGSNYAFDLALATERNFAEFGGEITFSGAVNVGDTDMTAILTNIASNPPDVLFFPIFQPEGDYLVAQAKFIPGLEDVIMLNGRRPCSWKASRSTPVRRRWA